jgi:hypothetical protein
MMVRIGRMGFLLVLFLLYQDLKGEDVPKCHE